MEFDPQSTVVRFCLLGMASEDRSDAEGARRTFLQAWNAASNDFEKFLASWFVSRQQPSPAEQLDWLHTSLNFALASNSIAAQTAFATLHRAIANCYRALNESPKAEEHDALAHSLTGIPVDQGPFYHGTRADLQIGDLLVAGGRSNYKDDLTMNHIYFTALPSGAGLAAALAKGEGAERVYVVRPTGEFEADPNVTDKKFPGNLTRSYRSSLPLEIIDAARDWRSITPAELQEWREKLAKNTGEIIN